MIIWFNVTRNKVVIIIIIIVHDYRTSVPIIIIIIIIITLQTMEYIPVKLSWNAYVWNNMCKKCLCVRNNIQPKDFLLLGYVVLSRFIELRPIVTFVS